MDMLDIDWFVDDGECDGQRTVVDETIGSKDRIDSGDDTPPTIRSDRQRAEPVAGDVANAETDIDGKGVGVIDLTRADVLSNAVIGAV